MPPTLLKGNCLEVMKTLPDKSVDCFICDLPYGQLDTSRPADPGNSRHLHSSGKRSNGCCSWDVKIDLEQFWEQVERLAKNDHVPIIHFCNTKFGIDLINSKPSWFRYDLVWNKERGVSFLLVSKMPMKSHEMIYIFSKKSAYYNRIDIKGNDAITRCPLSVINVRRPTVKGHPTEKPLELYKWLIERYSSAGDTVLDPTAGSFNSVEAAHNLGRNAIGIEMDEGFYKIAKDRLLTDEEEEEEIINEFTPLMI